MRPASSRFVGVLLVCAVGGCGGGSDFSPKLATVSGTVKLNGEPTADLMVVFEPQGTHQNTQVGAASSGITDASGHYELLYQGGPAKGAVVGPHVVRITSNAGGGPAGGDNALPLIDIPVMYNLETTLSANVKETENPSIDFELTSKKK